VRSGRLTAGQLDQNYLAKCINVITNCAEDSLLWSQHNAYGSSFPDITKAYHGGGWYFSAAQAFDLAAAWQFNSKPAYLEALLCNLNYEAGCNPINLAHVTGLGWKRQRNIVDQYSDNDQRFMPKNGISIGNIQMQFYYSWTYGWELGQLTFPSDNAQTNIFPFYDRWCDEWDATTEGSTTDIARSLAATAWLAAQTSLAGQPWRFTNANIVAPTTTRLPNQPVSFELQVADTNLTGARIIWEARDQEAVFGGLNYTFTPGPVYGPYWVEAEVDWPDGRRAYATNFVYVTPDSPSVLSGLQKLPGGGFTFQLAGTPDTGYIIQVSTNLQTWSALSTNTVPGTGVLQITNPPAAGFTRRFYRAVKR
jgi:hypothetical protein